MCSQGPNYSVDNQITFIIQWFRTWSELQKDDFVEVLAQKLAPGSNMNGLVNGMQKLDTESRRVSLFSCQIKLINEWWPTWSEAEKENLTARLKESDPKFWIAVQEELNGTRKKLEDDFFLLIGNCNATEEPAVNGGGGVKLDDGEGSPVIKVNGESDTTEKLQNGDAANVLMEEEKEEDMEDDNPSG